MLVTYSSATGNTRAFVDKLGVVSHLIDKKKPPVVMKIPFVLVTPTYADGEGRGAVPKAVISFLNEVENRKLIRGVIAGGNRNFGATFALAGQVIAQKCAVPCLYRFELRGTDDDVARVIRGLQEFWNTIC